MYQDRPWLLLKRIRAQLILLVVLVVLEIAKGAGLVPPPASILRALGVLLERGGWSLLLPVSFAEHVVGLNVYFPGSVVIFVSVSSLTGKPGLAVATVLVTMTGAVLAHQVNFLLGRRLRGRQDSLQAGPMVHASWGGLGMFAMFWHPHFGALSAVVAGREGVRYRTAAIVIVAATVFWQTAWGLVAYHAGKGLGQNDLGFWPMAACVVLWAAIDWFRYRAKEISDCRE